MSRAARLRNAAAHVLLGVLMCLGGCVYSCVSQAPIPAAAATLPAVHAGRVMEPARAGLVRVWRDSAAVEHGGCIESWSPATLRGLGGAPKGALYRVWTVSPLGAGGAREWTNVCAPGQPYLHTHTLFAGETDCSPSAEDYQVLDESRAPFAVLQCDRRAFVFFFPRSS